MSVTLKGVYPWNLGVTSFVIPADVVANVEQVATMVDDVQLLFFESAANAKLDNPIDLAKLQQIAAEHVLSYTVHLPTDIRLGAPDESLRRQGIDEIERLVSELEVISPRSFDLHLNREEIVLSEWFDCLEWSLENLAVRLGEAANLIGIENIDYELDLIRPLIEKYPFNPCIDVGHILFYGQDLQSALNTYLPSAIHVHLHGIADGKDHQAFDADTFQPWNAIGKNMQEKDFTGTVTLELYSIDKVYDSLAVLQTAWKSYEI